MIPDKFIKEMIELIDDMDEDLMDFYKDWQSKRPVDYPLSYEMRAIRKYVEDFRGIKNQLETILVPTNLSLKEYIEKYGKQPLVDYPVENNASDWDDDAET